MITQRAPIALFIYRRPNHTRRTIEHLQASNGWERTTNMLNKHARLLRVYILRLRTQGLVAVAKQAAHPRVAFRHLNRIIRADSRGVSNFYSPSYSRDNEIDFCSELMNVNKEEVRSAFSEIERDTEFIQTITMHYSAVRPESPSVLAIGRFKCWYALVRLQRPSVVVETGVHDGLSSALILRALSRNAHGKLVSIDLPSTDLPETVPGPGWLVPDDLRSRWELHLGDARKLLPALSHEYGPIDIFIHDSDHTRSHREFEYRTALTNLARPGFICTDHDEDPDLLDDFSSEVGGHHCLVRGSTVDARTYIGGIRCP